MKVSMFCVREKPILSLCSAIVHFLKIIRENVKHVNKTEEVKAFSMKLNEGIDFIDSICRRMMAYLKRNYNVKH